MINRVILVGRLVSDPELRKTGTGNSVCSFTVAVDNRGKDAGTSYIPCVAFNELADNVTKFMKKGSLVGVDGRLNQRSYVRKENNTKVRVIEVLCDSVKFLDKKKNDGESDSVDSTSNENEEDISFENIDSVPVNDTDEGLPF